MRIVDAQPYACGNCKKHRVNDTNHWYVFQASRDTLVVERWHCEKAEGADEHACGQECATAMISRWMGTGKLTE